MSAYLPFAGYLSPLADSHRFSRNPTWSAKYSFGMFFSLDAFRSGPDTFKSSAKTFKQANVNKQKAKNFFLFINSSQ